MSRAGRHALTPDQVEEAKRLYTVKFWGVDRLGLKYGCTGSTVAQWLRKAGVNIRGQGTGTHHVDTKLRGVLAQATQHAEAFKQRSLISFPESPQLQADWEHVMSLVRAERGSASDAPWGF